MPWVASRMLEKGILVVEGSPGISSFATHYFGPGSEVIKLFSCSTQLSMKFSPLIDVKMPTIVGILTCMSGKNNILGLTEP